MSLATDLRHAFPAPHPAGHPFILGAIGISVIGLFVGHGLSLLGIGMTLFCLFFFRDPARIAPLRATAIIAPADGRVVSVTEGVPPAELGLGPETRCRVSIFLSVLNVHVNRVPISGTVTRIAYRHGAFLSASLDKASEENERNAIAFRLADGREIAVVQIAGLIARRILCTLREGDAVRGGDRLGIIRFGSRTDLYLPAGVLPLICEGQTMIGGETVVAELNT